MDNANTRERFFKEKYKDNIKSELAESLAKADAFGQGLTRESVRLIQLSEPEFNSKKIKSWVEENKIKSGHENVFEMLVVESEYKPGWFQKKIFPTMNRF